MNFNPEKNFYMTYQFFLCGFFIIYISGCSTKTPPPEPVGGLTPYKAGKKWYKPLSHSKEFIQRGKASWYGKKFHGRKTSNGEIYNMYAMTAAHKTLPFGTYVRVKNLNNKKKITVRINDRGPFVAERIIDLSFAAAKKIGIIGTGTAPVKIVALGTAVQSAEKESKRRSYIPADYHNGNFTFQVAAFKNRENAKRLKQKLDRSFENAHLVTYDNGEEIFYRVRVGRCSTLTQVIEFEKLLNQKGFTDPFVVAE